MKKIFILLTIICFSLLVISCEETNNIDPNQEITLPDLSGKSREEITRIMEQKKINYVFKFSNQIINSNLDLDTFVSYNSNLKAGDKIKASYQVYVYTTVLPLTFKISDQVKLDKDYQNKSFINDGIGKVTLNYSIDGDTADFYDPLAHENVRVRFLGIDTPESTMDKEPWGKAASNYTKERLSKASTIVLEAEGARQENYGRYLAFVWVDGVLLNLELVEQAYTNSTLSNSKYEDYFFQASAASKKTGRRFFGETDPNYDYENKRFK